MDNYLIDQETLGQFIDDLIKRKPLPINSTEELAGFREQQIQALDEKIGLAIFGKLTEERNRELNDLLDRNEDNPEVFKNFFAQSGIDLDQTITETLQKFASEYLGGENV